MGRAIHSISVKEAAPFLGDIFAAERHKYIPVGLLPPSMAAKIRLQKIPSECRCFFY
jgi:hypothetical protein